MQLSQSLHEYYWKFVSDVFHSFIWISCTTTTTTSTRRLLMADGACLCGCALLKRYYLGRCFGKLCTAWHWHLYGRVCVCLETNETAHALIGPLYTRAHNEKCQTNSLSASGETVAKSENGFFRLRIFDGCWPEPRMHLPCGMCAYCMSFKEAGIGEASI